MRIRVATDPNKRPEQGHPNPVSVIPDHVRAVADVVDCVWSTHRDHYTAMKYAHAKKLTGVLDFEDEGRVALDNRYADPDAFFKHLKHRGTVLRSVRRRLSGIQVACYDVLRVGLARDQYRMKEWLKVVRDEDKELNSSQFHLLEAYVYDLQPDHPEADKFAFEQWRRDCDFFMLSAAVQGAVKFEFLLSPLAGVRGGGVTDWVFRPELFRRQLGYLWNENEGPATDLQVGVQVWPFEHASDPPEAAAAWDIVTEFARRPAPDTVPGS